MYDLVDELNDNKSDNTKIYFNKIEQYFDEVASYKIGNEYLSNVWRYFALDAFSNYLLNNIEVVHLLPVEKTALKRKIIQTQIQSITKMEIGRFIKGKYSLLLQENAPVSDYDKYMPLLFLLNTYHNILTYGSFSCDDPFIHSLIPIQNKVKNVLALYKTNKIILSDPYNSNLETNIGYIEATFPRTMQTLKSQCNIHD